MPLIITVKLAGRWRMRRWVAFTMNDYGECGPAFSARSQERARDLALDGAR
jgi:hypothetical protein